MTERLHFHFHFHALEKVMATHSSVLAWRIPGTGEPGRLPPMGHTESDMTEVTQQQQQQIRFFEAENKTVGGDSYRPWHSFFQLWVKSREKHPLSK